MVERLVVVGGDAAGMSAATQAKRLRGESIDVIVFERSSHTSYSACGIPYWVAGDVDDAEDLVARTPEQHRANGLDLRLQHEVTAIDLGAREVTVHDLLGGRDLTLGFDQLMVASGAVPRRPDVPGVDARGIHGVQTLDDGAAVIDGLRSRPTRAVVVGGGYIGVEMAEACQRRGMTVTVVEAADEPMATLDPDMGHLVREAMEGMGIEVRVRTAVEGFEADAEGRVQSVLTAAGPVGADLVVLGTGVAPNSGIAGEAGLALGPSGGLRTDQRMQVVGADAVWAAGDCVESFDRVSRTFRHVPLGTHANKQGRVAGVNLGGGYLTFPGVVGTAISKVCDLEIARTGLHEADAHAAGFEFVTAVVESTTRAGYFPGAQPVTVKLLAERRTGRLLGAQIVGREAAAKRIDACAVALWNGMSVEEISMLDLAYAPPFAPVWDPVLVAARKAATAVRADLSES